MREMATALMDHLDCSIEEAVILLDELERAGHLRYAAEARSAGGSAGAWIVYPTPGENPDMSVDPSAPESPASGRPAGGRRGDLS